MNPTGIAGAALDVLQKTSSFQVNEYPCGYCQAAHPTPGAPTLEAFQHADHLVEVHAETSWKLMICIHLAGCLDPVQGLDVWENLRNLWDL